MTQDDNARFTVAFLNAGHQTLNSLSIGPVLAADRSSRTALLYRSATAIVPSGTRVIRCSLLMSQVSGSHNDGMADNLSVTLSAPPQLSIGVSGGDAILSWPAPADNWALQQTFDLSANPVVWSDLAPPYQSSGNTLSRSVPGVAAASVQFFRLRK